MVKMLELKGNEKSIQKLFRYFSVRIDFTK
jgi:hypothetical protein